MRQELEQKLIERYPEMFRQRGLTPMESPMAFGFEVGDGWYDIIAALCRGIDSYVKDRRREDPEFAYPEFAQVKEKFGDLRIYLDGADDAMYAMVDIAAMVSATTCEACGNKGNKNGGGYWISTLCNPCREGKNNA